MAVAIAGTRGTKGALKCRRKFLRFFPKGFGDPKYIDWERGYKWEAHERWHELLGQSTHRTLVAEKKFSEVARRAVTIESRTNLLFSFEKMALRDAIRVPHGAKAFATGLYEFLYGRGTDQTKFEHWCDVVAGLPRRQTRVLTWPLVTVFGFIALPNAHFFLKPMVTRKAASEYDFDLRYRSTPSWEIYSSVLEFAQTVTTDQRDLRPKDMIDIQSFLWVQGSDEYE